MEGVRRVAVNPRAYMFNPTDLLVPVPDEMRQDRGYGLQLLPLLEGFDPIRILQSLEEVSLLLQAGHASNRSGHIPLGWLLLKDLVEVRHSLVEGAYHREKVCFK